MPIQFCERNNLSVIKTLFKHPKSGLNASNSPGDVYKNKIDYIVVRSRFRNMATIGSDHNPVMRVKLKLIVTARTKI